MGLYATLVAARTQAMYRRLSTGDWDGLLAAAARDVVHDFPGDHALGGRRTSRDGLGRWVVRFRELYPRHRFDVLDVVVRGGPWRTRVAVAWRGELLPRDGAGYTNAGVHWMTLRWGRIARLEEHVDTAKVVRALDHMAAAGIAVAGEGPVEDPAGAAPRRPPLHRLVRWLGHRRWFAAVGRRFAAPADRILYRVSRGRVGTTLGAVEVLLLTTTGRRTGRARTTPVMYVRDSGRYVISSEHFGQQRPAAWPLNLDEHPEASIRVGRETVRCRARRLEGAEADRTWGMLVEEWPAHATYRRRSGARHVFALEPIAQGGNS